MSTCAVGLVNHGLHNPSPGINKPRRCQRQEKKCEEVFRGPESRKKKEGTAEGIHIRAVKAKGVGGDLSAPRTAPSPTTHQLFTCRMVSPVSWASCFFCSSEGYGCCSHQQESFGLPHCCPSLRSSLGASGPGGRRRVGKPLSLPGQGGQAQPSLGQFTPHPDLSKRPEATGQEGTHRQG